MLLLSSSMIKMLPRNTSKHYYNNIITVFNQGGCIEMTITILLPERT